MPRTKRDELSKKARKFLDEFCRCGSIPDAARAAGYSQPNFCYQLMATDDEGLHKDPRVAKYFADRTNDDGRIVATIEPPKHPQRQPQTLTYVDALQPPPCPDAGPTTEWQIQVQAWILADPNSSSNSKVNASRELRALMSQSTQRAPDPQKAINILRKKMLPYVPPSELKKS